MRIFLWAKWSETRHEWGDSNQDLNFKSDPKTGIRDKEIATISIPQLYLCLNWMGRQIWQAGSAFYKFKL
jgi:hypothetical protein